MMMPAVADGWGSGNVGHRKCQSAFWHQHRLSALQSQVSVGELLPTNQHVAAGGRPRQQPLAVQVVLTSP